MRATIVIPTHNRPQDLRRALASALAALPEDGEIVVVDDRSDPPAAEGMAPDGRVRLLRNDGPPGASGARNHGVQAARRETVFFLDDDDEMLPGHPDRILRQAGTADCGFSHRRSRRGDPLSDSRPRAPTGLLPPGMPWRLRVAALSGGFRIRREVFLDAGGLDPGLSIDEDTDLCCRLIAAGRACWYAAEPGVIVRAPDGAGPPRLTDRSNSPEGVDCYRRTCRKNWEAFAPLPGGRWFLLRRYLRRAVRAGEQKEARVLLRDLRPPALRIAGRAYLLAKSAVHAAKAGQATNRQERTNG